MNRKLIKSNGRLKRLEELESKMANHSFEFGMMLAEIKRHELYLETHDSWKAYCKTRWGITGAYGYDLIKTSETFDNVSTMVDTGTAEMLKGRHLREVAKAPKDKQAKVVKSVLKRCEEEERQPTAKDFKEEVEKHVEQPKKAKTPDQVSTIVDTNTGKTAKTPEDVCTIVHSSVAKPAEYYDKVESAALSRLRDRLPKVRKDAGLCDILDAKDKTDLDRMIGKLA